MSVTTSWIWPISSPVPKLDGVAKAHQLRRCFNCHTASMYILDVALQRLSRTLHYALFAYPSESILSAKSSSEPDKISSHLAHYKLTAFLGNKLLRQSNLFFAPYKHRRTRVNSPWLHVEDGDLSVRGCPSSLLHQKCHRVKLI